MARLLLSICVVIFMINNLNVGCTSQYDLDQKSTTRLTESPLAHNYNHLYHQQHHQQMPTQFQPLKPLQALTYSKSGSIVMPANNNNQLHAASNFHHLNSYQQNPSIHSTSSAFDGGYQSADEQKISNEFSRKSANNIRSDSADHLIGSLNRNVLQSNIELALRHASGDENIFQPSPIIGSHDNRNFNWLSQSADRYQSQQPVDSSEQTAASSTTVEPTPPLAPSTTEHNNDILTQNEQQQSIAAASSDQYNQELQKLAADRVLGESSLNLGQTPASNSSGNKQVFYEGPATPAAPSLGDYYFSSSERMPNISEKSSNAWWALGINHDFDQASNLTLNNYLDFCAKSELLVSNKQRSLCRSHPKILPIVARGLKLAIEECQAKFSKNRWNCSLIAIQESISSEQQLQSTGIVAKQGQTIFGDVMKHPNRERSFLNAIIAAGLAHAMTKACSQGELPEECSCDRKIKSKSKGGKIEWIACSDDIDFGARFSRDFTDNPDTYSDSETTLTMISNHNYEVGRRVFKSSSDITCTCQQSLTSASAGIGPQAGGESINSIGGLCQQKKCWKHLGPFSEIGDELMRRYESATHVQTSNKDPHKLRPVRRGVRKPKRKDLVYIDESPDYCTPDTRLGVLGTQNRHCNSTSMGPDSCSLLCCSRGYQVVVEEIEEDCNCKFVWCCQVRCDKCKKQITNDVCN